MPDHWSAPQDHCNHQGCISDAVPRAYLKGAYRRDLPLATLDQALLIAAQAARVPTLGV